MMDGHMAFTHVDLLAAAGRSLVAAGARDRAGWVGLFTADAVIEDPVGSVPHHGLGQIDRFYSTFIAPRGIAFRGDVDIVVGTSVVRDLELDITMARGVALHTPAYLRYDLEPVDGELKISRLQAFWELSATAGQLVRNGVRWVPAGGRFSVALVRNQGAAGAAGFAGGLRGVRAPGKQHLGRFLDDARVGDEVAVRRRLAKGASITIGDTRPLGMSGLVQRLRGARFHKLIASGHSVVAGVERAGSRGVLIAELEPKVLKITRVRYFESEGADGPATDSAGLR
jgi:hypothetical protein